MRAATCSVGLVSPRSTWESIGAETPERTARSRSERSIASRSAFTRGPMAGSGFDGRCHYECTLSRTAVSAAHVREGQGMATAEAPTTQIPEASIGRVEERELPRRRRCAASSGPSVILVGVGIASGEYILFPYIASQVGLVFLWAGIVGLLTQYFINMEIERYTLATGETAVTGFQRLWKPFGLLMIACAIVPNIWPAWATSAATITTFLFGGGNANAIAIGAMVLIGIALSASPVVYQTIEKFEFVKVALVLVFLVVALTTAVSAGAFGEVDKTVTSFGSFTGGELELAVLLGALAYAGAGGTNNLVVSNWIRDKGYGMGKYAPRVVSPITGSEEAAPSGRGYVFPVTDEPRALERLVAQGQHRAVRVVLRDRRDHDRRLLTDRVSTV